MEYPLALLDNDAFAGRKEADAESDVGEAMKQAGFPGYFTKWQLAHNEVPPTETGRRYAHSYSAAGGWYVAAFPNPFHVGSTSGTDHATTFSYDTHVPLAFYGLAFQPGIYRTHAEPVDLAATLASLLGINPPARAIGRVLTEALASPRNSAPAAGGDKQ
jgi:arylsulfatase A-like enzyme